jgi:hypothetical protein
MSETLADYHFQLNGDRDFGLIVKGDRNWNIVEDFKNFFDISETIDNGSSPLPRCFSLPLRCFVLILHLPDKLLFCHTEVMLQEVHNLTNVC